MCIVSALVSTNVVPGAEDPRLDLKRKNYRIFT